MSVPLHTSAKVVAKSPASSVVPTRTAGGPPMREDHVCVIEGCGKPLPKIAVKHEDPSGSSACCRVWYGVELAPPLPGGRRQ